MPPLCTAMEGEVTLSGQFMNKEESTEMCVRDREERNGECEFKDMERIQGMCE